MTEKIAKHGIAEGEVFGTPEALGMEATPDGGHQAISETLHEAEVESVEADIDAARDAVLEHIPVVSSSVESVPVSTEVSSSFMPEELAILRQMSPESLGDVASVVEDLGAVREIALSESTPADVRKLAQEKLLGTAFASAEAIEAEQSGIISNAYATARKVFAPAALALLGVFGAASPALADGGRNRHGGGTRITVQVPSTQVCVDKVFCAVVGGVMNKGDFRVIMGGQGGVYGSPQINEIQRRGDMEQLRIQQQKEAQLRSVTAQYQSVLNSYQVKLHDYERRNPGSTEEDFKNTKVGLDLLMQIEAKGLVAEQAGANIQAIAAAQLEMSRAQLAAQEQRILEQQMRNPPGVRRY